MSRPLEVALQAILPDAPGVVEASPMSPLQQKDLDIPYPPNDGPGGNFGIVSHITPIDAHTMACFFWRRKVSGWQRDTWRFLSKNRLEARHWAVLEQDREVAEAMQPFPPGTEHFYQHDLEATECESCCARTPNSRRRP